jgi:2-oxoglutarate ferredoxin oxidoreductase subunit beta
MATATAPARDAKEFKPEIPPDWCPGCGDFGVLNGLFSACAELGLRPHEVLVVSGIGCSSNLPGFIRSYGVHSLHGRAVPTEKPVLVAAVDVVVADG